MKVNSVKKVIRPESFTPSYDVNLTIDVMRIQDVCGMDKALGDELKVAMMDDLIEQVIQKRKEEIPQPSENRPTIDPQTLKDGLDL